MNFWTEQTFFRKYRSFQLIQSGMKIAESIPRLDLNIHNSFDFVSLALTNFYLISNNCSVARRSNIDKSWRSALALSLVWLHMIPIKDIDIYSTNSVSIYTCNLNCSDYTGIKINSSNIIAVTLWQCSALFNISTDWELGLCSSVAVWCCHGVMLYES